LCVAPVGGDVLISTNPTGGSSAWVDTPVFPAGSGDVVSAVSCAPSSLCVAVGFHVTCVPSLVSGQFCFRTGPVDAVTTDPTGGPGGWKKTELGGGILNAVSCPSTKLCVAVGAGTIQSPSGPPYSVVVSSRDPTGGPGAWRTAYVDGANTLNRISCGATTQCVAVDDSGNVVSSSDPSAGTPAWAVAHLTNKPLTGVSCPSVSLCAATDNSGVAFTATRPTGGINGWAATTIDPSNSDLALSVSCPSVLLCVAVDRTGHVIVGSGPSRAQIKSLLGSELAPTGKAAGIAAVLKHLGYQFSAKALSAGTLQISWYYVPNRAHLTTGKPKRVLIATGTANFPTPGATRMTITLTRNGERLLKHTKQMKITANGSFTAPRESAVLATNTFTLKRNRTLVR
jgi:hypothetical protein